MAQLVEVQVPGASLQEQELDGGALIAGSAPDAQLRLRGDLGFLPRHLQLTPEQDGVVLAIANEAPGSIVFRGQEGRAFRVPWGEEAYVLGVRFGFVLRNKKQRSGLVLLLLPVALLALGLTFVRRADSELTTDSGLEPPQLTAAQPALCKEQEPERAQLRATEAERAGHAKVQRSPFVREEGVEALDLLAESAACYRASGRSADAERADRALRDWAARMETDYAAARLRLKVALDGGRHEEALAAVRSLQALLSPRPPSQYTEWLTHLGRQLERRVGKAGS